MKWIKNDIYPEMTGPLVKRGLFAAGSSQAIAKWQLLERTGNTNTEWVPIDSDHDATAGAGLAIAGQDVISGDPAGYYEIFVPIPGDVWEADLATAAATAPETALYYSSPTALAATGSNIIAYSVEGPNHPATQRRNSQGELGDSGVTFRSIAKVWFAFRAACSIFKTNTQKA